ncbi:L,D-transpeptidase family protein [Pedobacter sp. JY14-1]|uniref:L,D-transpeptidase family protein n=1 Tax=Pedobacter sp. JY14-1 TaxID=3034151 RepID=UPI0023E21955|nr:L,D-transpeptidase family protein [Pedobacter sp. JY14-1]
MPVKKINISLRCFFLNLIVIAVWFAGCRDKTQKISRKETVTRNWDQTIKGNFSEQKDLLLDSARIAIFLEKYPVFNTDTSGIREFYQERKYAYAWFEGDTLIEQAGNLINRVTNIGAEGISKSIPYRKQLDSLRQEVSVGKKVADPELELMLTAQYFVFSRYAWDGADPDISKKASWFLPRKKVSYQAYLDSMLRKPADEFFTGGPVYRQYNLLRSYLSKYRDLNAREDWTKLAAEDLVKPGSNADLVKKVRQRLFLLGDFKGDTTGTLYDDTLLLAVKQFQERHGLENNGTIGKQTLYELNVSPAVRISQLLVNMERSRWMPVSLEGDYLGVNIPEYKLHVYHADSLLWSTNVVVGQTMHQTSVFYGEVQYIVFSPYWNVPPGILRQEVIPAMKRDPNYLRKHNMEKTGIEGGLPVIRQKPGPENSLGLVKFMFPNSYNIYLHDTPSKSLFGESSRAFSHGCIRVSNPARLASFLLKDTVQWSDDKISAAMHAGKERYVTLKKRVPVFIAYFTAFVDRDGRLNFRKDIYKLDQRLSNLLYL